MWYIPFFVDINSDVTEDVLNALGNTVTFNEWQDKSPGICIWVFHELIEQWLSLTSRRPRLLLELRPSLSVQNLLFSRKYWQTICDVYVNMCLLPMFCMVCNKKYKWGSSIDVVLVEIVSTEAIQQIGNMKYILFKNQKAYQEQKEYSKWKYSWIVYLCQQRLSPLSLKSSSCPHSRPSTTFNITSDIGFYYLDGFLHNR